MNVVLFPGMALPIHVFEERYKDMIGRCLEQKSSFGVALIKSGLEAGEPATPFEVGTAAAIAQVQYLPEGRLNLVAVGQARFRILRITQETPYLVAEVENLSDVIGDDSNLTDTAETVSALFAEYYRLFLALSGQWLRTLGLPGNPITLADFVAGRLPADNTVKQELLETLSISRRLSREADILGESIRFLTERWRKHRQERYYGCGVLN